jgi:hypothetical protein
MPPDKHLGKQGFNYQFCSPKIFNPCKSRSVNIYPLVFVHAISSVLHQFFLPVCYSFFICCYLSSCESFRIHIHSFYSIILNCFCFCSVHSVSSNYFLLNYLGLFSVLIPITTTILQVNKHHTIRLCHLLS